MSMYMYVCMYVCVYIYIYIYNDNNDDARRVPVGPRGRLPRAML